jgi:adenosylhomocysteine nucleosidase
MEARRTRLETLAGYRTLFVMAARAEYGPGLQARIAPLFTGVGPVEAGVVLGAELARRTLRKTLPDLVVSLGSAGSARLAQGGIYQVSSVSYRDMNAEPLGFPKGATPFLDQPVEIALPFVLPEIEAGRLSTGANIVTGAEYGAIDADMVDMETFAVMRACQQFGVALLGLRGISDGASELREYADWTSLLRHIDSELSRIIDRLESLLSGSDRAIPSRIISANAR